MLIFGLRGHLFRSEDAGETWEKIETGTVAILNSGVRLEDGTIVGIAPEGFTGYADYTYDFTGFRCSVPE